MSDPLHLWSVDRMLVCVPARLPDATVVALRALLADDPSIDAVLELLTADGLAATPPFLCAAVEPIGARVVIRGDLEAVAHSLDGSSLALGAGRSATWNDDVVSDIASISVALGDGSTFEWIAATGAPSPAARPAPTAPAVPSPSPELPAEGHTLDEHEYQRVVARDEPSTPTPDPSPASSTPAPAPDPPSGSLDFSGLLAGTSHERVVPDPPAPAPAPAAEPPPSPPPATAPAPPSAPEPGVGLPPGVVPPRPATRSPISAVPPAGTAKPAPPTEVPAEPGTGLGEHDGRTVTLADLRRLQEEAGAGAPPAAGPAPVRASEVRAVRCPAGHANPPTSTSCRLCGDDIADTTVVHVPRPVIARLVFDSGLVVDVDRSQLIGRRPTAPTDADELPNLITVPSPDGDISRVHTAVRVEGWDVLVEDVGSTNGTEVRLPSRDPVRLREHDPVLVVVGTEVTLAGTVRFTVAAVEQ